MLTINKDCLPAIKRVCKIAPAKSANSAFECVHARTQDGRLILTCGDGVVESTISIPADIDVDIEFMVNAQKFTQSIHATNGGKIELKDDLVIKQGRRRFTIKTLNADAYPFFNDDDFKSINLSVEDIKKAVDKVSFCAAVNDVRYFLNGVLLAECAVATNGHRMAVTKTNFDGNVIVPIEAIKKFDLGVGIVKVSESAIRFDNTTEVFTCKLIDGKFPDYKRVIPNKFNNEAVVNRAEFVDALKAVIISAPTDSKTIHLKFDQESIMETSVKNSSSASVGFDAGCEGAFEFHVNSSYLLDAFNALQSDSVTLFFADNAIVIDQDGLNLVIMRVRA